MSTPGWKIPLCDVVLSDDERDAVGRVLDSGWLTMGPETAAFEREFAASIGVEHAVAVANCTAALHLALKALDIGPGDEVLCPSLNFCAGPNVVIALGADVVFVDIASQDDLCLSPDDAARRITPRTKAIISMHYAGHPCDMHALRALARAHGLALVEDAAHAPGASLDGATCGALSDVGCFSFYSNKNMTTGEGGMVTTRDPALAERMRLLRSHGLTASTIHRHRGRAFSYDLIEPGYNMRIDELRAAMGRAQLTKLKDWNGQRAALAAAYRAALAHADGITLPFAAPRGAGSYHIQPALLAPGVDRTAFMEHLKERGIQTSIHYPPVHQFDWYADRYPAALPVTEEVGPRLVTLPLYATMTGDAVETVCEAVREFFHARKGTRP